MNISSLLNHVSAQLLSSAIRTRLSTMDKDPDVMPNHTGLAYCISRQFSDAPLNQWVIADNDPGLRYCRMPFSYLARVERHLCDHHEHSGICHNTLVEVNHYFVTAFGGNADNYAFVGEPEIFAVKHTDGRAVFPRSYKGKMELVVDGELATIEQITELHSHICPITE